MIKKNTKKELYVFKTIPVAPNKISLDPPVPTQKVEANAVLGVPQADSTNVSRENIVNIFGTVSDFLLPYVQNNDTKLRIDITRGGSIYDDVIIDNIIKNKLIPRIARNQITYANGTTVKINPHFYNAVDTNGQAGFYTDFETIPKDTMPLNIKVNDIIYNIFPVQNGSGQQRLFFNKIDISQGSTPLDYKPLQGTANTGYSDIISTLDRNGDEDLTYRSQYSFRLAGVLVDDILYIACVGKSDVVSKINKQVHFFSINTLNVLNPTIKYLTTYALPEPEDGSQVIFDGTITLEYSFGSFIFGASVLSSQLQNTSTTQPLMLRQVIVLTSSDIEDWSRYMNTTSTFSFLGSNKRLIESIDEYFTCVNFNENFGATGTDKGNIHISTDAGRTWEEAGRSFFSINKLEIKKIAVVKRASSSDFNIYAFAHNGAIIRSIEQGLIN